MFKALLQGLRARSDNLEGSKGQDEVHALLKVIYTHRHANRQTETDKQPEI